MERQHLLEPGVGATAGLNTRVRNVDRRSGPPSCPSPRNARALTSLGCGGVRRCSMSMCHASARHPVNQTVTRPGARRSTRTDREPRPHAETPAGVPREGRSVSVGGQSVEEVGEAVQVEHGEEGIVAGVRVDRSGPGRRRRGCEGHRVCMVADDPCGRPRRRGSARSPSSRPACPAGWSATSARPEIRAGSASGTRTSREAFMRARISP